MMGCEGLSQAVGRRVIFWSEEKGLVGSAGMVRRGRAYRVGNDGFLGVHGGGSCEEGGESCAGDEDGGLGGRSC